jgi:hypothetical protein
MRNWRGIQVEVGCELGMTARVGDLTTKTSRLLTLNFHNLHGGP